MDVPQVVSEVLQVYIQFFNGLTPKDLFPIMPTIAIAYFAFQQWKLAVRMNQRDFSARLLSAFGKIQPLHNSLLEWLGLVADIKMMESLNEYTNSATFEKYARLRQGKGEFSNMFQTANLGSQECMLLLGVHRRSAQELSEMKQGELINKKLTVYLLYAHKVYSKWIVEAGHWDGGGCDAPIPSADSPDEAKNTLRELNIELLNLVSERINFHPR